MFTALQYCTMYGFLAVALTPDLMTAAVLSSAFYGIWNLTAGFIMPQPVCHAFQILSGAIKCEKPAMHDFLTIALTPDLMTAAAS